MDRYTRKDANAAFERLIKAIGGRIATKYNDVGAYRLDYAGCYGGFNIERIYNDGGGITQPFGMQRHKAREFCDLIYFTMHAMAERDRLNPPDPFPGTVAPDAA